MNNSALTLMSVGIVSKDKESNSDVIYVYPLESLPFVEGDINSDESTLKMQGVDSSETEYDITLKVGMSLQATWLGSTNRRTSPNVRSGEQVLLYTNEGTEEYWWVSLGRNDDLRRRETVIYTWNASGHGPEKDIEITPDNSYSLTIDTEGKNITLNTSKDNGESFEYTIQLDADNSHFTMQDDKGNLIQLDSKNTKILLKNNTGSEVALDKADINITAPGTIGVKAGGSLSINCSTMSVKAGSVSFNTPSFTVSGSIRSPDIAKCSCCT